MKTKLLLATIAASAALLTGADEKPTAKSGNAFDQKFLTETPQHHQHAIEMARLCEQKAAKSDVKGAMHEDGRLLARGEAADEVPARVVVRRKG